MAASKQRIDWGLLLLRLAVGGMAILHGLAPLRSLRAVSASHALPLLLSLLEVVAGTLLVLGVWMVPAVCVVAGLLAWPLVDGWRHGAPLLGRAEALFRLLATLACGLGGGGRWAVGKG